MFLNKSTLKAVRLATATDGPRWMLTGVRFEPGRMIGCDGHRMHVVEWGDADGGLEACTVDGEAVRALEKRATSKPMILSVDESNRNGALTVVDPEGQPHRADKLEGEYPNTDKVWPTGDPVASVTLDARYLKDAAEAAIAVWSAHGRTKALETTAPTLTLEIRGDATGPVVLRLEGESDERPERFKALVMPRRK